MMKRHVTGNFLPNNLRAEIASGARPSHVAGGRHSPVRHCVAVRDCGASYVTGSFPVQPYLDMLACGGASRLGVQVFLLLLLLLVATALGTFPCNNGIYNELDPGGHSRQRCVVTWFSLLPGLLKVLDLRLDYGGNWHFSFVDKPRPTSAPPSQTLRASAEVAPAPVEDSQVQKRQTAASPKELPTTDEVSAPVVKVPRYIYMRYKRKHAATGVPVYRYTGAGYQKVQSSRSNVEKRGVTSSTTTTTTTATPYQLRDKSQINRLS